MKSLKLEKEKKLRYFCSLRFPISCFCHCFPGLTSHSFKTQFPIFLIGSLFSYAKIKKLERNLKCLTCRPKKSLGSLKKSSNQGKPLLLFISCQTTHFSLYLQVEAFNEDLEIFTLFDPSNLKPKLLHFPFLFSSTTCASQPTLVNQDD